MDNGKNSLVTDIYPSPVPGMANYPVMKDSGVDWLGEIPAHWEPLKIINVTTVKSEKNFPDEELLSVYRDYGVIIKSSRDDNYNRAGEDLGTYKLVKPGYLVLNKMKTWQGSLGISEYRGIVSPAYITCEVDSSKVLPRYLHYLLRCKRYVFEYNRLSYGVRVDQWDMRYQDFKNIPIFLPPLAEQTAIADFLDRKTAQIDAYVALKEKAIALLQEQKTAIINRAVTQGLNPAAPLKDSGIEWLGEIPAHWEVKKLKYIGKQGLTNGLFKKKDYFGTGTKLINVLDVYQDDFVINYDSLERVQTEPQENKVYSVQVGDIFFVRSS